MERELTAPTDLCDAAGRLSPAAVGWSRQPLHRANLRGAIGRKKRWDYWCVLGPDLAVSVTYADIDYLGIAGIWIHEFSTGFDVEVAKITPFGRGLSLPDDVCSGTMEGRIGGLELQLIELADCTRIIGTCGATAYGPLTLDLRIDRPAGHESLNVVIPWSDRRFQFTSKHNGRPASGTIRVGDRRFDLDEADPTYGIFDLGRGIWPYSNRWNWAAASGRCANGGVVGLQFGGKWTEGTGYTENGVSLDGRLHKIGTELTWDYDWDHPTRPWHVTDSVHGRVDARLEVSYDRHSRVSAGVLSMEVHQCFGHWSGTVVLDDGTPVEFSGVAGFAEEARNRW